MSITLGQTNQARSCRVCGTSLNAQIAFGPQQFIRVIPLHITRVPLHAPHGVSVNSRRNHLAEYGILHRFKGKDAQIARTHLMVLVRKTMRIDELRVLHTDPLRRRVHFSNKCIVSLFRAGIFRASVFLQELGSDFSFVARQKRMSTGKKDRYLDLLFFHRRLRRLIALDLKIGSFDPAYKGQMEWYLNWLDQHDRLPHEEKPIGIILCADTDREDIEYLEMDKSGIHVAQYIMELPPKDILERKLKQAIATARELQTRKQLFHKR